MSTNFEKIRAGQAKIFRRCKIKRRLATTGAFESTWQDISDLVESWGKVRRETDFIRYSTIKFADVMMRFDNTSGKFNPNDDDSSMWWGYGSQQRTLLKLEAGFLHQTLSAGGIWTTVELPTNTAVFHGIVSGDIFLTGKSSVQVPVRPLMQVFRDYPAARLIGFTSTGLSASQFMNMLRDQTDGSSNYIFRPFFQDTTSAWDIAATSNTFAALNTSGADDVYDATCWEVMEKLAEAEDKIIYVKSDGTFRFGAREPNTTTVAFKFVGAGYVDNTYGHTIKEITKYGKKQSDYYSRVECKHVDLDTTTSFRATETSMVVAGGNDPWNLGARVYSFENFWLNTATADTVVSNIYNNVALQKNQIELKASFVTHLDLFDRVTVSYDSGALDPGSRWDIYDWAENTTTTDLTWARDSGDAIRLQDAEFKILSLELDLDKLETKVSAVKIV